MTALVGDILVALASIVSMIVLSSWLFWPRLAGVPV